MARRRKNWITIAAALLAALLLPLRTLALNRPDTTAESTLTVAARYESAAVAGMAFSLRRAAAADALGHFALTAEFAASGVNPDALVTAQDFSAAARSLRDFAEENGLAPAAVQTTDLGGNAAFSALEPGLYLVTAAEAADGRYEYTCAPFLLSLPALSADGESWDYDAAALPKLERRALPDPLPEPEPEPTAPPTPEPTETPAPAPEETPSPQPEETPLPTAAPDTPGGGTDTLPQTGQLQWPIPVLAALGLLLAAAGICLRRRSRDD